MRRAPLPCYKRIEKSSALRKLCNAFMDMYAACDGRLLR